MSVKQRLVRYLVGQFGRPHGLVGHLVGWALATRPSNRQRNLWVVSLLDVAPADRVLEIGFGAGIAIQALGRIVTQGQIFGVDASEIMVRKAAKRNAALVRAGRVDLALGSVDEFPAFGTLDKIFAVNSLGFWPDPPERLKELRRGCGPAG